MFVLTIIAVMLLGDLVWWLVCRRRLARAARGWRWAIGAFTLIQAAGLMLVLFTRTTDHGTHFLLTTPVIVSVYLWHFLFAFPFILAWSLITSGKLVARVARWAFGTTREHSRRMEGGAQGIDRRQFLRTIGAAAPAVITLGATGVSLPQLRHFRVRKTTLPIVGLPAALDGLTIAHLSDLHVGQFTNGAVLDEVVEATNRLQPQLIVATGDLINFALNDLPAGLSVMTRLRAEHGVFMCEGNHDLFESAREFRRRTRAAGVRLLVNESAHVSIRGTDVQILGLQWGGGAENPHAPGNHGEEAIARSMRALLSQRSSAFPILLAHHPHAFDHAADVPLTFAGHTHGGQLMLNGELGCGPMIFRYWSGLYRAAERAMLVSNGTGNWFPLRTAAPAEIIHVTLRAG